MTSLNRPTEVLSGDLEFFWAYTLIDITDTGYSNPKGNTQAYRQAQNLNTLIQLLSLRTQLVISSVTIMPSQDLTGYSFGSNFTGTHTVWLFKFASEKPDAWARNLNPLYYAINDCDQVPVNIGLDETAPITNMFNLTDAVAKNMYFQSSDSL